jgi:hypothetical protein
MRQGSTPERQNVAIKVMPCCAHHAGRGLVHPCGMHRQSKHSVPVRGGCAHCGQSLIDDSSAPSQSALRHGASHVVQAVVTFEWSAKFLIAVDEFPSRFHRTCSMPPPRGHLTLLSLHCALII